VPPPPPLAPLVYPSVPPIDDQGSRCDGRGFLHVGVGSHINGRKLLSATPLANAPAAQSSSHNARCPVTTSSHDASPHVARGPQTSPGGKGRGRGGIVGMMYSI